ncbi:heavy-metal-associated domain-containing protein [Aquimarina sp. RZ0]|uniref:heavy-metal-associated domain-containing protein n=1 Tax=Aquimarina sp. RZ0 TaxID=2607730 RepID=UPI0011F31827|nr:heavy-metal-associated domain-containing protein [Aquimarina sp. RZ0]KAA1247900.1 cation transporter [Aquimarina sp. RZ0]
MKKAIIALILLGTSCNLTEKEERVLIQRNDNSLMVINVPEARCKKCQKIIEEGLQYQEGVQQSILDLNTKKVSIVYQPDRTSPKALETTVETLVQLIPCK